MNYDLKDFRIDQLLNLYLTGLKDVYCYHQPTTKEGVWFQKRNGQVLGKLYSWIENTEGVFMMFFINDDFSKLGQPNSAYFIKLEPKLIEWESVKTQLDAQRRAAMNFYDRWFEDLEVAIDNYQTEVEKSVKNALITGGLIVGGILFYQLYFKPYLQSRATYRGYRDAMRGIAKRKRRRIR